MKVEIQKVLYGALFNLAKAQGLDVSLEANLIEVERCKDASHGDFASNVALKFAKAFAMKPRDLAYLLLERLPKGEVFESVEVAGAGFINFRLKKDALSAVLASIVNLKDGFGLADKTERRVLLEFVSANPTGPLHVGHGRGAAYGDSLARLLKACGDRVDTEYYVNDAGRQMDILALSVYWRYMQLCGVNQILPKGIYQGDYVIEIAEQLKKSHGEALLLDEGWIPEMYVEESAKDAWIDAAILSLKSALKERFDLVFQAGLKTEVLDIKEDLEDFNVFFDRWFSERSLFESQAIDHLIVRLQEKGLIYEQEGALWFKATLFGDEKDRVVRRENGITTYFASDIAYHYDKYMRNYDLMIDIFGADHHGYMARVRASLQALDLDPEKLCIALVQFAVLYQNGEKVQMSTRSGEFVTLRALREQVGSDAARFFYVMRKPDQHMDFDLDLAVSQSKDNPYYYVQYAHARTCRVLERAKEMGVVLDEALALKERGLLQLEAEQNLLRTLARYPELIINAGKQLAPHMVVAYLRDLATCWHQFYDAGHKVLHEDEGLRQARLLLTDCVRQVLCNALAIVGVKAQEKM